MTELKTRATKMKEDWEEIPLKHWFLGGAHLSWNRKTKLRKWDLGDRTIKVFPAAYPRLSADLLREEMYLCFCALSTERLPDELVQSILSTPLHRSFRLRRYDTGMVCTGVVEMLKSTQPVDCILECYADVFQQMGYAGETSYKHPRTGEPVGVYPDSVGLSFEIDKDHTITFGYSR